MARCMLMILLATSVSSQLLQRPSDNHHGGDSQDVVAKHEQDTVLSRHRRGKSCPTMTSPDISLPRLWSH